MKNKIKVFSDIERFMVILFDQMKIQENLMILYFLLILVKWAWIMLLPKKQMQLISMNYFFYFEVQLTLLNLI